MEEVIPYVKINGHREKRSSGNANISFEFVEGEDLLLKLDSKGICVSKTAYPLAPYLATGFAFAYVFL